MALPRAEAATERPADGDVPPGALRGVRVLLVDAL